MQSLRHAPHRLDPPGWPGRRTSISVFSLKGDAFPAVVSLLLLLAGDIELNPGPNCYTCRKPIRRGMDFLQCQANSCTNGSNKQLHCSGFSSNPPQTPCVPFAEEPQTIEHWLRRCPRLDATRQNIFGSPSPPLKVLTTDPERVLALARVTLG